jgi:ribonuclease HII
VRAPGDDRLAEAIEERVRRRYGPLVAGVDEAGRGPLAGPLVVAAVVLPPGLPGVGALADSKALTAGERERLARWVRAVAVAWALWRVGPRAIDRDGVGAAVRRGMAGAVAALAVRPHAVLVDGPWAPPLPGAAGLAVVDGDRLCAGVMAASILAKTARDREMRRWGARLPGWGFEEHKGYATAEHRRRLQALGPSPIHRRSFLAGRGAGEADDDGPPPGGGGPRAGGG